VLTGGGDLLLRVGGAINPIERTFAVGSVSQESNGVLTNLRGNIRVDAGAIGRLDLTYGKTTTSDPRGVDKFAANDATPFGGLV
ncbi:hypothetical protein NY608_25180, partial [Enterobacter hormaechei]